MKYSEWQENGKEILKGFEDAAEAYVKYINSLEDVDKEELESKALEAQGYIMSLALGIQKSFEKAAGEL